MISARILLFAGGIYFISTLALILAFHRGKRNQSLQEPRPLAMKTDHEKTAACTGPVLQRYPRRKWLLFGSPHRRKIMEKRESIFNPPETLQHL